MSKRALITGAAGFTGRYMGAELRQAGYEVFGLVHKPVSIGIQGVQTVHVCDLLDRSGLAEVTEQVRPDVVVHLAGISHVAHGDVDALYCTNLLGSCHLLEALCRPGVAPRAVLMASSANVYGNATNELLSESVPPAPANDYAVSKLAMEYMARLWGEALPITLVRPFNYTGVGQGLDFLLPKLVDCFRRRASVLELGNLDVVRDFSNVRVVVQRYRRLLEADGVAGETFNVCSGHGTSLQDVVQILRELTGHDPVVRNNPEFVRANEVRRLVGSCAKLDSAIGPVPAIALRDTLRWMLENPA